MRDEGALIREALTSADAVARRIARRLNLWGQLDELRSAGRVALFEAARSWDEERSPFRAYGLSKVKWAILDEVRRGAHGRATAAKLEALVASERFGEEFDFDLEPRADLPTEEDWQGRFAMMLEGRAAALAMGLATSSVDTMATPEAIATPEEQACRAELTATLTRAIAALEDERQRALILRHYFGDEQFDVIAADLGISKSRASRLHREAIELLGRALRQEP